ncbi:copper resistance CopC family protein [Arthrobacter sp. NPDC080073]|uniref:copper resistance CopC family protein n=1 Tax=Arthrobacter sp. NPDC080073 TaxID=3155919 RepID=UPI00341863D8
MGARYGAGRLPRAVAGFFLATLAAVLALVPVSPASAHDVLEGTEPANGSVVATVPSVVRLTFNNTPIALGSQILVRDANGTNQADGPVSIVDNVVSQAVKADSPAGRYTVVWRIVSSDTHPIEGTFTFTAGPGATAVSGSPAAVPEPAGSTGFPLPVAVIVAGVLAAGLVAGGFFVRRRLSGNDTGNPPVDESGDDG